MRVPLIVYPCIDLFQAANNLIVLAREPAGAERIFGENGVVHMKKLMLLEDTELVVAALRVISCLCSGHRSRVSSCIPGKLRMK